MENLLPRPLNLCSLPPPLLAALEARPATPPSPREQCDQDQLLGHNRMRRVSWEDHRRDLFALQEEGGENHQPDQGKAATNTAGCCSFFANSCKKGEEEEQQQQAESQESPGWKWKSSSDPDDSALANLFSTSSVGAQEGEDEDCVASVSSSRGGWKGDFTSHFKGPPSTSSSRSPAHSHSIPTPTSSSHSPTRPFTAPSPLNIRSSTPTTPRGGAVPKVKCMTPVHKLISSSANQSPSRIMECSCCARKCKSHLGVQLGVERELLVEQGPKRVLKPALATPPKKKPPMKFGVGSKTEFLNKAAAMNNASTGANNIGNNSNKARFTVLPVVTLAKASRTQKAPKNQTKEPEYCGDWERACASVFPRPGSSSKSGGHSASAPSGSKSGGHSASAPSGSKSGGHSASAPSGCSHHTNKKASSSGSEGDDDLVNPTLNSTANFLERLRDAKQEKFDATVADIKRLHHIHHRQHRERNEKDSELVQRYKDLCKISDAPTASDRPRMPRKNKTDLMAALRQNKPEISDLWVPSEQCPQVCSTAPIRIEPAGWQESRSGDAEAEREALCRGARNAMSLYGLPNLF